MDPPVSQEQPISEAPSRRGSRICSAVVRAIAIREALHGVPFSLLLRNGERGVRCAEVSLDDSKLISVRAQRGRRRVSAGKKERIWPGNVALLILSPCVSLVGFNKAKRASSLASQQGK